MALPYPDDPSDPLLPNPYFQDDGFVRGDQQRSNNAQIWADLLNLDGRVTVNEGDIVTIEGILDALTLGAFVERYSQFSNSAGDLTNDIAMTLSQQMDTTLARKIVRAAMTKRSDASWAVGSGNGWLDEGSIGDGSYHEYDILRSDTGVTDSLLSLCNDNSGTFTVTIATPGVVTWTDHGLQAGSAFIPSTTGALPTGMTAGTRYYVIATGLTADTFRFSATIGGAAINTTGSQSGVHSAVSTPLMPANYDYRTKRLGSIIRAGGAILAFKNIGNLFRLVTPVLDINAATQTGATPTTRTLASMPVGAEVEGIFRFMENTGSVAVNLYPMFASEGTPSYFAGPGTQIGVSVSADGAEVTVYTNKAAQIKSDSSSTITSQFYIVSVGWYDHNRGL